MSYNQNRLIRLLLLIVMSILGGWAIVSDNWIFLIPIAVVLGVVPFLLRKRIKEIIVDERVNTIARRASRLTFVVFVILAVVTGSVLIYLGKEDHDLTFNIGLTLNFAACALMLFYWAAYFYYNRKLGGKE